MPSKLWSQFELSFLALTIWREGRGGGFATMLAIACSIRNRVNRPSWWGKTYGEVLGKKFQYSSIAAPGDPQLILYPKSESDQNFDEALKIADEVVENTIESTVPGADSYYDISIPAPKWATTETFVGQVGRIRFHNTDADHEADTLGLKVS